MCLPQRNLTFKTQKEFVLELLIYNDKRPIYDELLNWRRPKFPICESVLRENICNARKVTLDKVLYKLRDIWAESNFQMSQEELLQQHLTDVQQKIAEEESVKKKKVKINK